MVKVNEIAGPLVLVQGVSGVAFDELVEVVLPTGEVRSGKVLEVSDDKALIQVFEGTEGLEIKNLTFRFKGKGLELPVSRDILGRIFSGRNLSFIIFNLISFFKLQF